MKNIGKVLKLFLCCIIVVLSLEGCVAQEQLSSSRKDVVWYQQLAEDSPLQALVNVGDYKTATFAPKVLEIVARRNPGMLLSYSKFFIDQPYAMDIIQIAARTAAHNDPSAAILYTDIYKKEPWAKDIIALAARKKPYTAISFMENYNDQPWAPAVIGEAIKIAPAGLLYKYMGTDESREDFIKKTLVNTYDKSIDIILTIGDDTIHTLDEKQRMLALLQDMTFGDMTLEEADTVIHDTTAFFRALIKIENTPGHLARFSVDNALADVSLRMVEVVNDLHDKSPQIRFASVNKFTPLELYNLMVYSEEEIYTSTFNGFFDRLMAKMKKEHRTGEQQLQEAKYNRFKVFIKQMVYYNRLDDFLHTMDEDSQRVLLESFVKGLDKDDDFLAQAVTVADAFGIVKDPRVASVLRTTLVREYDRISKSDNQEGILIYGILNRMFGAGEPISYDWVEQIAKDYNIDDPLRIPSNLLFDSTDTNYQQYFFYDDEDGHKSFSSFLAEYRNSKQWNIDKQETYIHITSVGLPRRMEIYANNPGDDQEGPLAIENIFQERKIEPQVIVHRGHSYHVNKTINHIPETAEIVYLGSCGGYYSVEAVLQHSPRTHIITTKGSASAAINDPLLKLINMEICRTGEVEWPDTWNLAEKKLGKNDSFKDYIPPQQNLAVLFLKVYHKKSADIVL